MKCLWKVTKQLTEILPSLKLDQLLREIHLFFSSYSRLVATPTASDTPYRTAKTVLYHLTTLLGSEVSGKSGSTCTYLISAIIIIPYLSEYNLVAEAIL